MNNANDQLARKQFHTRLMHELRGKYRIPCVGGQNLDLFKFYQAITSRGGVQRVQNHHLWKDVAKEFGFPTTCTSASYTLRQHYIKFLLKYEQKYYFGKDDSAPLPEIQPGRIRVRLNKSYQNIKTNKIVSQKQQQVNVIENLLQDETMNLEEMPRKLIKPNSKIPEVTSHTQEYDCFQDAACNFSNYQSMYCNRKQGNQINEEQHKVKKLHIISQQQQQLKQQQQQLEQQQQQQQQPQKVHNFQESQQQQQSQQPSQCEFSSSPSTTFPAFQVTTSNELHMDNSDVIVIPNDDDNHLSKIIQPQQQQSIIKPIIVNKNDKPTNQNTDKTLAASLKFRGVDPDNLKTAMDKLFELSLSISDVFNIEIYPNVFEKLLSFLHDGIYFMIYEADPSKDKSNISEIPQNVAQTMNLGNLIKILSILRNISLFQCNSDFLSQKQQIHSYLVLLVLACTDKSLIDLSLEILSNICKSLVLSTLHEDAQQKLCEYLFDKLKESDSNNNSKSIIFSLKILNNLSSIDTNRPMIMSEAAMKLDNIFNLLGNSTYQSSTIKLLSLLVAQSYPQSVGQILHKCIMIPLGSNQQVTDKLILILQAAECQQQDRLAILKILLVLAQKDQTIKYIEKYSQELVIYARQEQDQVMTDILKDIQVLLKRQKFNSKTNFYKGSSQFAGNQEQKRQLIRCLLEEEKEKISYQ